MTAALWLLLAWQGALEVKQGEVLRLETGAARIRFDGREIPVFQGEALVPVRVDYPVGPATLELLDASSAAMERRELQVLDGGYLEQNVTVTGAMRALRATPGEREAIERLRQSVSPQRLWTMPLRPPARGCMNSPYGVKRLHNGKPTGRYHLGLDQRGAVGAMVRAPADGVVRISRMFQLHGGTVARWGWIMARE